MVHDFSGDPPRPASQNSDRRFIRSRVTDGQTNGLCLHMTHRPLNFKKFQYRMLPCTIYMQSSQRTRILCICRTRFTKSAGYQCPYQSPAILHIGAVSSGDGESPDIISNHNYVQLTPSCCAQDKLTPLTNSHSPFFTKTHLYNNAKCWGRQAGGQRHWIT